MGGLTIGLTLGFAAAGGGIGFFGSIAGGFLGAFIGGIYGDRRVMDSFSPVKDGLKLAFAGGVAGLAIGFTTETAIDYFTADTEAAKATTTVSQQGDIIADCGKRIADGQQVTLTKTTDGTYACIVKPQP